MVEELKSRLKKLIAANKIHSAIEALKEFSENDERLKDDIVLIESRLVDLEERTGRGVLDRTEEDRVINQIRDSLLKLINKISEKDFFIFIENSKPVLQLKKQLNEVQTNLEIARIERDEYNELLNEHNDQTAKLIELGKEREDLLKHNESLKAENEDIKVLYDIAQNELQSIIQNRKAREEVVLSLKEALKTKELELDELITEIGTLQKSKMDLENHLNVKENELKHLKLDMNERRENVQELMAQFKRKDEERLEHLTVIASLKNTKIELEEHLEMKQNKLQQLEEENKHRMIINENLESELVKTALDKTNLQTKIEQLMNERTEITRLKGALNEQLGKLDVEHTKLETLFYDLEKVLTKKS